MSPPTFICPECRGTTDDPKDVEFGYCPHCKHYTGADHTQEAAVASLVCRECGCISPWHLEDCSIYLESLAKHQERFGDSDHPSLRGGREKADDHPILIRSREEPPHPGDRDWPAWCRLSETVNAALAEAGIGDVLFSKRRHVALHLWQHGYRG